MAKRVLVTGGARFLGSHLCERLLAMGHDVLCVDNYFTGNKDNIGAYMGIWASVFQADAARRDFPLYVGGQR
jgi:UDP-glucuronate decarboxylase